MVRGEPEPPGGLIVNVRGLDAAETGFTPLTMGTPALETRLAGTKAVTSATFTKVDARFTPFH